MNDSKKKTLQFHLVAQLYIMLFTGALVMLKLSAKEELWSTAFFLYLVLSLVIYFLYTIAWQRLIMRMPLTKARLHEGMTIVWTLFFGFLIFRELITLPMILGSLLILAGMLVIQYPTKEENARREAEIAALLESERRVEDRIRSELGRPGEAGGTDSDSVSGMNDGTNDAGDSAERLSKEAHLVDMHPAKRLEGHAAARPGHDETQADAAAHGARDKARLARETDGTSYVPPLSDPHDAPQAKSLGVVPLHGHTGSVAADTAKPADASKGDAQ